ncbi:geranylgeranyl transferase type II beta subunit, putative [Eimeria maxima]|uniref:Geranylgeranyl transferase type II beta subunit, putative n=1 Tax=Eimeria maxima TaxID=5804 RepID=U6MAI8_EIMMA|nr:geranylgeranyl transferase type II beta subunit, putative [Eimeria maxima]CDJ58675.1 geranylgeranyl transferase type II beta subunit, putative [Eimeria maxima]
MEVLGTGQATAAEASEQRYLNVTAHRLYVLRQLQKGLRMFCGTPYVEEIPSASSVGISADVAHTPFMELQQQQQSLVSGLYWTLCCLAVLQPRVTLSLSCQEGHHPETNLVPLPPKVKEDLIFKVILSCLRRRQCTGWASAAPEVRSPLGLAERGEEYGGGIDKKASQGTVMPSTAAAASLEAKSHLHCDRSAIGFSSNMAEGATATALSTCSGLQALALLDALPLLSEGTLQQLRRFVLSLQRLEDGAFANTLHRRCWSNLCSSCSHSTAGAPVPTVPAAATTEEVEWESEGDVRSTFCCLLSLKLIHAAVKARHNRNAAVPVPHSGALAARAVGSAAEEDSAAVTPEEIAGEKPAPFREGPTDPDPWQHPSGGISRASSFFHSPAQKGCVASAACEGCTEPSKSTNENNDGNSSGMYNPLSMLGTGPLESSEKQLRCPDPFHTFFALAGLSLLAHGWKEETKQLELQQREPQQEEQEHQIQQNLQWQATCRQLLQPLDPQTALPLQLANSL